MAKTTIKGKFATGADVATVHHISEARQQWLDREINKATADVIVFFSPQPSKAASYKSLASKKGQRLKRATSKTSGKTVRLRAKKK